MIFTNAQEVLSDSGLLNIVIENEDGSIVAIPADESNSDYQRYLRWLENPDAEEGGTL